MKSSIIQISSFLPTKKMGTFLLRTNNVIIREQNSSQYYGLCGEKGAKSIASLFSFSMKMEMED